MAPRTLRYEEYNEERELFENYIERFEFFVTKNAVPVDTESVKKEQNKKNTILIDPVNSCCGNNIMFNLHRFNMAAKYKVVIFHI